MNAEQIRAEAIEVLAREFFGADEPGAEPFRDWAPRYRRKAAPYVDALAAAGLLPVETQRLAAYAALDTSDEQPGAAVPHRVAGGGRMTRSRASAKKAGTAFESSIASYLAEHVDDRIERRAKTGAKDRGDLSGVRAPGGGRVVAECKDYGGQLKPGPWIGEAETERGHDDALVGCVVAKRRGVTDPGAQFVLMTVRDFIALLTGRRPEEKA